jgi:hypothetical protein
MRALDEGGAKEYKLAQEFDDLANLITDGWPRTAAVLRDLAAWYREQGRREDEEVERRQRGPHLGVTSSVKPGSNEVLTERTALTANKHNKTASTGPCRRSSQ